MTSIQTRQRKQIRTESRMHIWTWTQKYTSTGLRLFGPIRRRIRSTMSDCRRRGVPPLVPPLAAWSLPWSLRLYDQTAMICYMAKAGQRPAHLCSSSDGKAVEEGRQGADGRRVGKHWSEISSLDIFVTCEGFASEGSRRWSQRASSGTRGQCTFRGWRPRGRLA